MVKRYGEFARLHKHLRTEFPGKHLPALPRKNKSSTTTSFFGYGDDDRSSVSSVSTQDTGGEESRYSRTLAPGDQDRSLSRSSFSRTPRSPRASGEVGRETVLFREDQRVSLRAFLRTLLQNKRIAESKSLKEFLSDEAITLNEDELIDMERRKEADAVRVEEQKRFYEIARQRAAELDSYMENFRRDIVESSK